MASDLNRVFLIGRLTRDPELRQVSTGSSLCRFSIANGRTYVQNGERREETSYFDCIVWGRVGEIVQQYCQKGKQVGLEGRLRQSSWEDSEGKKRSRVEVVVENLQLLGSRQENTSFQPAQGSESTFPSDSRPADPSHTAHVPPPPQVQPTDDDIPF